MSIKKDAPVANSYKSDKVTFYCVIYWQLNKTAT